MSGIKQTIEVKQPLSMLFANHGESFTTTAQECEACNGNGGRYIDSRSPDYTTEKGEHYKACAVCQGCGKIAAQVVIRWQPSGSKLKHFRDADNESD